MENSNHVPPNCNGRLATQPMILTLDLLRFKSTLLCRIQLPAAHLELTLQLINILCLFIYLFIYLSIHNFLQHILQIEEKGTKFAQGIEIDEKEKVAVFRVPAHNGIIGADFYNDFKMVSV